VKAVPPTSSLVPIPDDVVETSDDDDDGVDQSTAVTHVSHQPRPFAVRSVANVLIMTASVIMHSAIQPL